MSGNRRPRRRGRTFSARAWPDPAATTTLRTRSQRRSRYRRDRGSSTGCGWRRRREHPTDGLVVRLTDEAGKHLAIVESQIDADAE
ncbi:MAG: hypothetical protein M3M97_04450 [Actinomycetota bacterium]|nr:hypothetical protein [Actinomycetota bacterium]